MPRFQAKPVVVEAYQFHGTPHDLPIEFAAYLTQEFVGEKAYLPSTAHAALAEGAAQYATADIVYPGDWLVRGMQGLYRMGPGEFEQAFAALDDPSVEAAEARWQATYYGAGDNSTPNVLHWLGYRFLLGVAVGVNDPVHAAQIAGNAHFSVVDTAILEALNDGNAGAVGSEDAAQAWLVDSVGSERASGPNHLLASGLGQEGVAGDWSPDPRGEPPAALAKRGPGRPRRADLEGVRTEPGSAL